MNLYLVGYMGSGKSSVGKRLSNRLDMDFVDLDLMIEDFAKASVEEIFAESGESDFRSLETHMLDKLLDQTGLVVATGGGTPCHSGNMEKMLETGFVVYLNLAVNKLVKRVQQANSKRPLIKGKGEQELKEFVSDHFETRRPCYEKAHQTVDADRVNAKLLDSIKDEFLENSK